MATNENFDVVRRLCKCRRFPVYLSPSKKDHAFRIGALVRAASDYKVKQDECFRETSSYEKEEKDEKKSEKFLRAR